MRIIKRLWKKFCFDSRNYFLIGYYNGAHNTQILNKIIKRSILMVFLIGFLLLLSYILLFDDDSPAFHWAALLLLLLFFHFPLFLMLPRVILTIQGFRQREKIIASGYIEDLLKGEGRSADEIPKIFNNNNIGLTHRVPPSRIPRFLQKNTGYQGWCTPLYSGVNFAIMLFLILILLVLWLLKAWNIVDVISPPT